LNFRPTCVEGSSAAEVYDPLFSLRLRLTLL
jgi:hypothetical protein